MSSSFGSIVLMLGLTVAIGAQVGICLHAFTSNPGLGLLCLFVPFYAYVYAKRHSVSAWLLRAWYAGIAAFVAGAVMVSA